MFCQVNNSKDHYRSFSHQQSIFVYLCSQTHASIFCYRIECVCLNVSLTLLKITVRFLLLQRKWRIENKLLQFQSVLSFVKNLTAKGTICSGSQRHVTTMKQIRNSHSSSGTAGRAIWDRDVKVFLLKQHRVRETYFSLLKTS